MQFVNYFDALFSNVESLNQPSMLQRSLLQASAAAALGVGVVQVLDWTQIAE